MSQHNLVEKDHWKSDIGAGLVVFLVALPLCLGIALASGAPLLSGLVAGIVGGLVVGALSHSHVSVSGPAAGLTVVVASAIVTLGSFEAFLCAVIVAGAMQLLFGVLRLGAVGDFVPTSVIRGMLTAIGIVIVLKQIPHALGRDIDFEGDMSFLEPGGSENTLSAIVKSAMTFNGTAVGITTVSLGVLLLWEPLVAKRVKWLKQVPAALVVVLLGATINLALKALWPAVALAAADGHLVTLPEMATPVDFLRQLKTPFWSAFANQQVYFVGATIAVVASIETLLSLEASEKLDTYRRYASPHRELLAQGVGNIVSGLLGGLPVTSVVVRTTANVYAGSRTRWSAIIHAALLLGAVVFLAPRFNDVPLSSLAAVLIVVGMKLAPVKLFKEMWVKGFDVFLPFLITVLAIVFTDLLKGVLVGLAVGVGFLVRSNYRAAMTMVSKDQYWLLRFNKDLTFVHKAELKAKLAKVPENAMLIVDGTRSLHLDRDVFDVLDDFKETAKLKDIVIELKNMRGKRPGVPGEEES